MTIDTSTIGVYKRIITAPGYEYFIVRYDGAYHGEVRAVGQVFKSTRKKPRDLIRNLWCKIENKLKRYEARLAYNSWSSYGDSLQRIQNHGSSEQKKPSIRKVSK